ASRFSRQRGRRLAVVICASKGMGLAPLTFASSNDGNSCGGKTCPRIGVALGVRVGPRVAPRRLPLGSQLPLGYTEGAIDRGRARGGSNGGRGNHCLTSRLLK